VRRIGVILVGTENTAPTRTVIAAFRDKLKELGWSEGRNLRIDFRYVGADASRIGAQVEELMKLSAEVIVCNTLMVTRAVQQQTRTIPIVFAGIGDPVATGVLGSLARPEGNTTGVTNLYYSIAGKWLEFLKQAAPRLARVALIYNPEFTVTEGWFAAVDAAAPALAVQLVRTPFHSAAELERAIGAFAAEPDGGAIVMPPGLLAGDREAMFALALRHRLPAIYQAGSYASEGGLMAYGIESADLFRSSAAFVDRLRGAKPGDLPVQFPTRFEFVINLKTARAIGLTIPPMLVAQADEVIE
jgi:putative tryptophan/tyrosine transport system substrate-binding protein